MTLNSSFKIHSKGYFYDWTKRSTFVFQDAAENKKIPLWKK